MEQKRAKLLIDRLPEQVDGHAVLPYLSRLQDGPHNVALNARNVAAVTVSGVEGLLLLASEQATRGNSLSIDDPSDAFARELAIFGVTPEQLKG